MVSYGTGTPTENCFLTTYHSSFMVHCWVLVHCGPKVRGFYYSIGHDYCPNRMKYEFSMK
jgi:hypothetical protein